MQLELEFVGARKKILKDKIRALIREQKLAQAKEALMAYERAIPDDPEVTLLVTAILEREGRPEEIVAVLQEGLDSFPQNFALLYRMGRTLEQQQKHYAAWNSYQCAGEAAGTKREEQALAAAIERVKTGVSATQAYGSEGHSITVKDSHQEFTLQYALKSMKERKALLEAILPHFSREATSVLEVECGEGTISRFLACCGLETVGIDEKQSNVDRARGFDFPEYYRFDIVKKRRFFNQFKLTGATAEALPVQDVILIVPESFAWFAERGFTEAMAVISAACRQARRQLFMAIPEHEGAEKSDLAEKIVTAVRRLGEGENCPVSVYNAEQGKKLILVEKPAALKGGRGALVPQGLEAVKSRSGILAVKISDCTNDALFTYGAEGWHYFQAAIQELSCDLNLTYDRSILKKYYDRYQPKNRFEQWIGSGKENLHPLSAGWPNTPWRNQDPRDRLIPKFFSNKRKKVRGGTQDFGPNSDRFGREELVRIRNAYLMIKDGYHPELYPDGFIKGYILKKGSRLRFVISEGQHRIAALAHFGYETVTCMFDTMPAINKVVDLDEIDSWPLVKNGLYSREVAAKVFDAYMNADGKSKAQRLGLI